MPLIFSWLLPFYRTSLRKMTRYETPISALFFCLSLTSGRHWVARGSHFSQGLLTSHTILLIGSSKHNYYCRTKFSRKYSKSPTDIMEHPKTACLPKTITINITQSIIERGFIVCSIWEKFKK